MDINTHVCYEKIMNSRMVLQKAMKQGRNVHGIPLLDACSDHNITSRMCGHVGGHAYSVRSGYWTGTFSIQISDIFVECTLGVGIVLHSKTC